MSRSPSAPTGPAAPGRAPRLHHEATRVPRVPPPGWLDSRPAPTARPVARALPEGARELRPGGRALR